MLVSTASQAELSELFHLIAQGASLNLAQHCYAFPARHTTAHSQTGNAGMHHFTHPSNNSVVLQRKQ